MTEVNEAPLPQHADVPSAEFYDRVLHTAASAIVRAYSTVRVTGEEVLANQAGPYLLAPKHASMLDILLMAKVADDAADTQLHFIGKDSLWQIPIVGRFFTAWGATAIDRSKALGEDTLSYVGGVFERDGVVCLFPEGTRRKERDVTKVRAGIAQLALAYNVPIIPVGIAGTAKGWQHKRTPASIARRHRGQFAVAVGAPIAPEDLPEQHLEDPTKIGDTSKKKLAIKAIRRDQDFVRSAMQAAQATALALARD